jgi:hypothetical protein
MINNSGAVMVIVNGSTAVFKGSVKANNSGEGISGVGFSNSGATRRNLGSEQQHQCEWHGWHAHRRGQLVIFGSPGSKVITALDNKESGINLPGFASITNLGGAKFVLGRNATSLSMGIESSMVMIGGLNLESNTTGLLADGAGSLLLAPNPANPSVGHNFSRRRIPMPVRSTGSTKAGYVETSCPIGRQAEAIHMSEKSPFRGLRANRGGLTVRRSRRAFPDRVS